MDDTTNNTYDDVPSGHEPDMAQESVGDIIRKTRITKRISLETIAKDLRLNIKYIKALESEDFSELPADAYARVYIRSIAEYLMLDPDTIIRKYYEKKGTKPESIEDTSSFNAADISEVHHGRKVVYIVIGTIIAVIVILGIVLGRDGITKIMTPSQEPEGAVSDTVHDAGADSTALPDTAQNRGPAADDTVSAAQKSSAAPSPRQSPASSPNTPSAKTPVAPRDDDASRKEAGEEAGASPQPAGDDTAAAQRTQEMDTVSPRTAAAGQADTAPAAAETPQATSTEQPPASHAGTSQTTAGMMTLRVKAAADSSWVQIYADGREWKNILAKGEAKQFTARDSFNVRVGRNQALAYSLNGQTLQPLDKTGVAVFKIDQGGEAVPWSLARWRRVFGEQ
jgi:cytoskeletal protein RodZ